MSVLPVICGSSGGYEISRSLRFNSADSAYLNRTPASAGNRKTWTWSGWVKRSALGTTQTIFNAGATSGTTGYTYIAFLGDNTLNVQIRESGGAKNLGTAAVYRDVSAYLHVVVAIDTGNATASLRRRIYINGSEITAFSLNDALTQNIDTSVNEASVVHRLGTTTDSGGALANYLSAYLTEVNFIDGQALTPSSFGETDPVTGVWKPKKYTGTYGTNGFYLNFSDNSGTTATTLGKDYSGNGNNWTPNNFSVTAGAGNDSLVDVPTLWGSDTGAGGEVRGNYATLNALNNSGTLANGNLDWNGLDKASLGTIAFPSSGKYYFEATCSTVGNFSIIGIADGQAASFNGLLASANFRVYNSGGEKADSTRTASWGSTFTSGDVIGVAVDMDNGAIYFAKNNTWQASGVPTSGASKTGAAFTDLISSGKTWMPFVSSTNSNGVWVSNFGQRPFSYSAPSGFKALCTTNLPEPTIKQGDDYFNVVLDTGANIKTAVEAVYADQALMVVKDRANTNNWQWFNDLVGTSAILQSNTTAAETTYSTPSGNSAGFVWKANGAGVTNTAGSITSTVSANTTAGFSVVTYTGTGAAATVGHGLGVAPKMIIAHSRNNASQWGVYHASVDASVPQNFTLLLNSTAAREDNDLYWNDTAPTSTVFSVKSAGATNTSTWTYVAYCFAPVPGYSAFGSYTGTGSADGPMVFTNFRPRYVMVKCSSSNLTNGAHWIVQDAGRSLENATDRNLYPNLSNAEGSSEPIDLLSNGFKIRNSLDRWNSSSQTFIFMAFAENPFKYSLAR